MAEEEEEGKAMEWPGGADEATDFDYLMVGKNNKPIMKIPKQKLNEVIVINGEGVKAVAGGATSAAPTILKPGPNGQNRKMEDVQGWFVNGTTAEPPVATGTPWEAPSGKKNTNWWDGTTWSLGSSVPLPKGKDGKDGQGILPIFDPSKEGGYLKDAQVRDISGNVFASKKDSNLSALSDKSSWDLISVANLVGTIWKCKEYNLNNGTGLVTGKTLNSDGTLANGTGGYLVIPITPNLWGKPIYIDGWTIEQFASGVGAGNYAFYNDSDSLVANGGLEFYGRYNIIPSGTTKLLIAISRVIAPTQASVDAIKVSVSFNRINENGKDCYITDIKTIANSVPNSHLRHNYLAFGKGRRTIANISNPAEFYSYNHIATQIIEITNDDKVLFAYKLTNNMPAYGVVFYDKNWKIIGTSDSIMTISIPNTPPGTSFIVKYNDVDETVFETPFAIPSGARYVIFGIDTNKQLTDRYQALTTISTKRLSANDFPINSYSYDIEVFNDIDSYKDRYDLKGNEEYYNLATLSKLTNGRFNALGENISGGQNATIDVTKGEVYTVIISSLVSASGEIGFGVYTDLNDVKHPLNLSNFSRVVIGNNGDTWPQYIRVYQIIPQSDWKSISVTTTASNTNAYFAIFKGVYDGNYLPLPNDRITKEELRLKFKIYQSKIITFLGDSITNQSLWQRLITQANGVAPDYIEIRAGKNGYRQTGVGGSTIYPGLTDGKVTNPATNMSITCRADDVKFYSPDVIFILGGRNDLGKNFVIGNSSNLPLLDYNNPPMTTGIAYSQANPNDTVGANKTDLSFASSYRGMLIKLMQNNPNAKIICLTPVGGNDGARNLIELKAIRQVILDICSDYGIQVIDTFRGVQINSVNYLTYAPDGVHPNSSGAKLMADYILSQI